MSKLQGTTPTGIRSAEERFLMTKGLLCPQRCVGDPVQPLSGDRIERMLTSRVAGATSFLLPPFSLKPTLESPHP